MPGSVLVPASAPLRRVLFGLVFLGQLGALFFVQVLGVPIPFECIALIVAGAGVAAGLARPVVDAAY